MAYVEINGDYVPIKYAPKILTKFYNESVLPELMDTEYESQLKQSGKTVKIRTRPTITGGAYSKGGTTAYPYLSSTSQSLTIDKQYYWSFGVDDIDDAQVDLNFINDWIDEANESQITYTENLILNAAPGVVVAANQGLTAGLVSSSFNLGTILTPLHLTKKETYTDAGTGIYYYNAADLMADMKTVLCENKVPKKTMKFSCMPEWVDNKIAKSDIKNALITGDETGVIRSGYIGKVGGMETYATNNFDGITTGGANGDVTVWPILFGIKEGWTFAAQIDKVEAFRLQTTFAMAHRGLWVFGWAQKIKNGLGVAYVTAEDKL